MDLTLTDAERELFRDQSIEKAFQAWWPAWFNSGSDAARKQFILRVRYLFQSGKL